jgi:hypothetical protein
MTVGVGIIGEGHLVLITQVDQRGHSVRTRAVHPNFAVMIDRHEGKRWINRGIYDIDIQSVEGTNWFPISQGTIFEHLTPMHHWCPTAFMSAALLISDAPGCEAR